MLSRKVKHLFYVIAGPLMKANAIMYRVLRAPRIARMRVQLGPGQEKYISGWVNVDANMFTGKCDIWADLRNSLPFKDETVECFYSHHVIEHLPNLRAHFAEVFRCLLPGGVYRVGGPNGDKAIAKFMEGDAGWFFDWPDNRASLGGRFENFIFCRGEHLTILTLSYLMELMEAAGFVNVTQCLPVRESAYPEMFSPCLAKEYESDYDSPHTLIVEAVKPGSRR